VGRERPHLQEQLLCITDDDESPCSLERAGNVGRVIAIWARERRHSERCRLDHIVSSDIADETAADERQVCGCIRAHQFAKRVEQQYVGRCVTRYRRQRRPSRESHAGRLQTSRYGLETRGMTRSEYESHIDAFGT